MIAIGLTLAPHRGGIVVRVIVGSVGVRSEGPQRQRFRDVHLRLHVDVEMAAVLVLFHLQQREGVADPEGFRHLIIFPVNFRKVRKGGVEGGRRIIELLGERQIVALLHRAHHTEVHRQMVVEGHLGDVELGNDVTVVLRLNHCLMALKAHRGTIIGLLITAAEGDMVVLHKACTLDGLVEVCVISPVDDVESVLPGRITELVGAEHLYPFKHRFKSYAAVVGDVERLPLATLSGHLDDTCSTSRAVLCRL